MMEVMRKMRRMRNEYVWSKGCTRNGSSRSMCEQVSVCVISLVCTRSIFLMYVIGHETMIMKTWWTSILAIRIGVGSR
jgi:hypothetical protein